MSRMLMPRAWMRKVVGVRQGIRRAEGGGVGPFDCGIEWDGMIDVENNDNAENLMVLAVFALVRGGRGFMMC